MLHPFEISLKLKILLKTWITCNAEFRQLEDRADDIQKVKSNISTLTLEYLDGDRRDGKRES